MSKRPWSECPVIEWDDANWEHATRRVEDWEIHEVIEEGEYDWWPHPKRRRGGKYANRFLLRGKTVGGRKVLIVVEKVGDDKLRPITAMNIE